MKKAWQDEMTFSLAFQPCGDLNTYLKSLIFREDNLRRRKKVTKFRDHMVRVWNELFNKIGECYKGYRERKKTDLSGIVLLSESRGKIEWKELE